MLLLPPPLAVFGNPLLDAVAMAAAVAAADGGFVVPGDMGVCLLPLCCCWLLLLPPLLRRFLQSGRAATADKALRLSVVQGKVACNMHDMHEY